MDIDLKTRAIAQKVWPDCMPILLPYDGMASQLYILDLPHNVIEQVIDRFCEATRNCVVTTLDSMSLGRADAPVLDEATKAKIGSAASICTIQGNADHARTLQLWIHPDLKRDTFDAELVFWSDQFFPDNLDETGKVSAFELLVNVIERFRELPPVCECVLSVSEARDPRADRDQAWIFIW